MTPLRLATHWGCLKAAVRFPLQSEPSLLLPAALSEHSCTLSSSGLAATMRYIQYAFIAGVLIVSNLHVHVNIQLYASTKLVSQCAIEGLTQLVKVAVRPRDLPEFFWRHLESDIELLGSSTGKSMDESTIMVHLVLKEILSRKPPSCED